MSNQSTFEVKRFRNRNGTASWRVCGWLHGIRIRKNFKAREEAAAEKMSLEIRAVQAASGMRAAVTFLTDAQLRSAEDIFRRLEGHARSLQFYLDYALVNYHEPEQQESLGVGVTEYIAVKKKELERTLISGVQLRSINDELKLLLKYFPTELVSECTPANLVRYLERGSPSLKTYNNRRGILSTFFKFALRRGWIAANPVEKTPYHRISHRRGSAITISAGKASELMAFVEDYNGGAMVPYFALCLFAGIRPSTRDGEICRLRPEHIREDTGVIFVEPEVSKVRMKRLVTLHPNLGQWLKSYPFKVRSPAYLEYHRSIISEKFNLTHDVLRHTFISMFVGKFRSMAEAALQAGNSEAIIRKHYLDLKTATEAEEFFSIRPKKHMPVMDGCMLVLPHQNRAEPVAV